jgi:hypothetical protein
MGSFSSKVIFLITILLVGCSLLNLPDFQQRQGDENQAEISATWPPQVLEHRFSNDDLSLEYPDDFYTFAEIWSDPTRTGQHNPELDADEILEIANARPGFNRHYGDHVILLQRSITPGQDLQAIFDSAYVFVKINYPEMEFVQEVSSVGGLDATQFTYERPSGEPWYKIRDIWVVKDDTIYIFSYWAYPEHFEEGLEIFEDILSTVQFIE